MGGNRRTRRKPTTFGRVLTNSSHVRSEARYRDRTHDLSGGRTSLRRLNHRSPLFLSKSISSFFSVSQYISISLSRLAKISLTIPEALPFDRPKLTLRKCSHSFRSISVRIQAFTFRSLLTHSCARLQRVKVLSHKAIFSCNLQRKFG